MMPRWKWLRLHRNPQEPLDVLCAGLVSPDEVNCTHYAVTPLQLACQYDRLDFVEWLLAHGADVNHQPSANKSCLRIAVSKNNAPITRALLNAGARITGELSTAFNADAHVIAFTLMDRGASIGPARLCTRYRWAVDYYIARHRRRAHARALCAIMMARVRVRDVRTILLNGLK